MTYFYLKLLLVLLGPLYYVVLTYLVEKIQLEKLYLKWSFGRKKRLHTARIVGYVMAVYVVLFGVPVLIVWRMR